MGARQVLNSVAMGTGRGVFFVVLAVMGCSTTAGYDFPKAVIPTTPRGSWPDAAVVVLDDTATLTYGTVSGGPPGSSGQIVAVVEHRRRLQILTPAGLRAADVSLPLDAFSNVSQIAARSVGPDGHIVSMSPGDIHTTPEPSLDDVPTLQRVVFHVPEPQVGGLIDYRYRRTYREPNLVPPWVFGGPAPVLRAELSVVVSAGFKVDYRYSRNGEIANVLPLRRRTADGRERLIFIEQDIPPYFPEPNMVDATHFAPWAAVVLTAAPAGRSIETWWDVAQEVQSLTQEAQDIDDVDAGSGTLGDLQQVLDTLRGKLRVVSRGGLGGLAPQPATAMLEGAAASDRDAAALLAAMLRRSGAVANLALLTSPAGPKLAEGFPSLYPFVKAVVAVVPSDDATCAQSVRSDRGNAPEPPTDLQTPADFPCASRGRYVFLDPACRLCAAGELPTELTGGRALMLAPEGPQWVDVPPASPQQHRQSVTLALALEVDGAMVGSLHGELRGAPAREVRERLHSIIRPPEQDPLAQQKALTSVVSQTLLGLNAPETLEIRTVTGTTSVEKPLTVDATFRGRMRPADDRFKRFEVTAAALLGPSLPGHWRQRRHYARTLTGALWDDRVASVKLPIGFTAEIPGIVRLVSDIGEYALGFSQDGIVLHASRRLVLKKTLITSAQWPDFRDFLTTIRTIESQPVAVIAGE